jgi:hypothetical protein
MAPESSYTGCHKYVPFETKLRIDDQLCVDFKFWIAGRFLTTIKKLK